MEYANMSCVLSLVNGQSLSSANLTLIAFQKVLNISKYKSKMNTCNTHDDIEIYVVSCLGRGE